MTLTVQDAIQAAEAAAAELQLPAARAEVMRAGSAVVLGTGAFVMRVSGSQVPASEAAVHLRVAAHLLDHGVPAARPYRPEPVVLPAGLCVTVWMREHPLEGSQVPPQELGSLLASVHAVPSPGWLPGLDPLRLARRRIESFQTDPLVRVSEQQLLADGLARCEKLCGEMLDETADTLVHGDLPGNVLVTGHGPVLIDFENTGVGDGAWDLARLLHGPSRFARSPRDVEAVLTAYRAAGGSAEEDRAFALLPVVDLLGASWAVAGRASSRALAAESHVRLAWVKDPGTAPPCRAC